MTATESGELRLIYPDAPGFKRGETSFAASIYARDKAAFLQPKILKLLAVEPMTADELAEALGETILNVRPRCSELRAKKQIVDSGDRRQNVAGHWQIVWRVLP